MNIEEIKSKDHRRMVLWFLMLDGDQCLGEDTLSLCFEARGKDITTRQLSDTINWLAEKGMVSKEIIDNYVFARLTDAGLDIAKGKMTAQGVRDLRPSERTEVREFWGR